MIIRQSIYVFVVFIIAILVYLVCVIYDPFTDDGDILHDRAMQEIAVTYEALNQYAQKKDVLLPTTLSELVKNDGYRSLFEQFYKLIDRDSISYMDPWGGEYYVAMDFRDTSHDVNNDHSSKLIVVYSHGPNRKYDNLLVDDISKSMLIPTFSE